LSGIQSVKGDLATDQSGAQVLRDEQHCYQVKIPLYHPDGLKQLRENAAWLGDQMHIEQRPSSQADVPAYLKQTAHTSGNSPQDEIYRAVSKSQPSSGDETSYQEQQTDEMKMTAQQERKKSDAKATRSERWNAGKASSSKWQQAFWDEVDTLNSHDDAAARIMHRIGDAIDPRNIWARVSGDSARHATDGDLFSKESLRDVVDVGSDALLFVPIGRGVRYVGEGLAAGVKRFGMWEQEVVAPESTWQTVETAFQSMDSIQAKNLKRFIDKLPQNSENIRVKDLLDGGKVFQADSAAAHIPGSLARYEKQIDACGNTVYYTKITYGPGGEIVHVVPKFPAGPKISSEPDITLCPRLH